MGKPRSQRRGLAGNAYLLFAAETTLGWRAIRHVSGAQGEEMLACGAWRDVYNELNHHIGYQVIANYKTDEEIISRRVSSPSVTVAECELNAGLRGKSRTAGMAEDERISRKTKFGSPLPPEDAIERAREKVKEWGRRRLVALPHVADVSSAPAMWDQFPELARRSG